MAMVLEVLPGGVSADSNSTLVLQDDEYEMAAGVVSLLAPFGEIVNCDGIIYRYDRKTGIWQTPSFDDLMTDICEALRNASVVGPTGKPRKLLQNYRRMENVTKYLTKLKHLRDDQFFDDARSGINFLDTFVMIDESTEWEPVDIPLCMENKARAGLAIKYDPDATCPRWEKFMAELFEGAEDAEDRIKLLAEFIGCAMIGKSTRYAKCLWLTGGGNNGKSTMAEVIEGLFAKGSVASISPKDWCDEKKYYLHHLMGARLNIVTEMFDTRLSNTEVYKAVISGDAVEGRQIRGNPIRFRPTAGHILACNNLPMTSDQSDGFWRRAVVLRMDADFTGKEKQQETLVETLKNELPGIAVWAIRGFQRLVEQGSYTIPKSSAEAKLDWKNDSDEIIGWMRDCCTQTCPANESTQASVLYENFSSWCKANNHRVMSSNLFGRRLTAMKIVKHKNLTEQRYRYSLVLKSNIGGINPGWAIGDN